MTETIHSFNERMHHHHILFSYQGEITVELVSSILYIMETNMDSIKEDMRTKKKVYNVLVECLENLFQHLEEIPQQNGHTINLRSAIFMISKQQNTYHIMTGNYILNYNVTSLTRRLVEINEMTRQQLREHYIEVLAKGELSAKGGTGLGLIDIIRKSGEKLEYDFVPINEQYSFFELKIKIE